MKKFQKGFTLAEILIAVALIAGILTATMAITSRVTKIVKRVDNKLDAQVISGTVFSLLEDDLKNRLDYVGAPFQLKSAKDDNDQLLFYVRKPAYQEVSAKLRNVSLTHYFMYNGRFYRGAMGTVFSEEQQESLKSGHLVLDDELNIFSTSSGDRLPTRMKSEFVEEIASGVLKMEVGVTVLEDGDLVYKKATKVASAEGSLNLSEVSSVMVTLASVDVRTFEQIEAMRENNEEIWQDMALPFVEAEEEVELEFEPKFGPSEIWNEAVYNRIEAGGRVGSLFKQVKIHQFVFYPN